MQNALDRAFYRDRYDYRRALVGFARDLNSDLDLDRLSERLVTRVVETLVVDRMALMLRRRRRRRATSCRSATVGFADAPPRLPRASGVGARLDAGHTVALDDPLAAAPFTAEEVEFWRDAGIYYFVPCVSKDGTIAVLALGRKDSDEPLNSEDMALLTAVAGAGGDRDRERPPLSAAASQGGRARSAARVQREHPRVARRRPAGARPRRAHRPLEPRARGALRPAPRGRRRPAARASCSTRAFVEALRAARRESPGRRDARYRVPLDAARHADGRRCSSTSPTVPLQRIAGGAIAGTIVIIEDITDARRSSKSSCRSPRRWRRSACWPPASRTRSTRRSPASRASRRCCSRAPIRTIRGRSCSRRSSGRPSAPRRSSTACSTCRARRQVDERPASTSTRSSTTCFAARAPVRHRQHQGAPRAAPTPPIVQRHRAQAAAGVPEPVPQRARRDAERRLADDRRRASTASEAVAEVADTGVGHPAGAPGAHLRPVLHHQGDRPGHRPGPVDHLRHRPGARRRRFSCDSAVGQGTRFTLTLPLAAARLDAARAQPPG